jgi:acetyl-CoA acetyltransferase
LCPLHTGDQSYAGDDIALWEIHETFAAQVLCHIKGLEDKAFVREKAASRTRSVRSRVIA